MSSTLSTSTAATSAVADETQPSRRRRRRPRWIVGVAVLGAVVAAFAGVSFGRYAFRGHPGPKAVESALRRFRAMPANQPAAGGRYPSPHAGVYELQGQGSEHVSFPPNSQRDGAVMPATVSYGPGGCWTWRVDYNVAHSEEYQFCPRGNELVLDANGNTQTWDFGMAKVTNVAHFTCEAPATVLSTDPRPSETYKRVCTGTSTSIQGQTTTITTTRIVGTEHLLIGGTKRPVFHQVQHTSITGAQTGTATTDWWLATSSGLPLRMERQIRLDSHSPLGGTITYTEGGSWQMQTVEPLT